MNIIFCLAHLAVPRTISIIQSSPGEDFLIVTYKQDIVAMLRRLYPPEKIFLTGSVVLISRNPIKMLRNMFYTYLLKHKVWRHFKKYHSAKIYFLDWAFCDFEFWLLKKLVKANTVFYKPTLDMESVYDTTLKAKIGLLIRWLVYFIVFNPRRGETLYCFSVHERFLQKLGAREFDIEEDTQWASKRIMDSLPHLKNVKIILLCGSDIEDFVSKDEYIRKIDVIINVLEKRFGLDMIAAKAHPRFPRYYSMENTLQKIPSDIDAQLLIPYFDVFIGYLSSMLFQSANAGKIAISLLDMIEPLNPAIRDPWKMYLDRNASLPIHYPASMKEFTNLLDQNSLKTGYA